jgi:two-component system alkaline phosphatase synthesis response regulator PhoP
MSYVLLIDNDEILRSVLAGELKNAGIAVQEAGNGREGLDKARAEHPAVIVLDEHMPEMDGQHFIVELQKEAWFKETRIIVFTALHDTDLMNHKMLAGVSDYLDKSTATPQSVADLVKKHLSSPDPV